MEEQGAVYLRWRRTLGSAVGLRWRSAVIIVLHNFHVECDGENAQGRCFEEKIGQYVELCRDADTNAAP